MADRKRAGRVDAYELDLSAYAIAQPRHGMRRPALQDAVDLTGEPGVGENEIDETRPATFTLASIGESEADPTMASAMALGAAPTARAIRIGRVLE